MKKVFSIFLGLFLVFGVAFLAVFNNQVSAAKPQYRNSQKLALYKVAGGSSNYVLTDEYEGHVSLVTPRGAHDVVVNGVIQGLLPKTTYYVWMRDLTGYPGNSMATAPSLGYFKLVTFTTDEYGNGDFHIKIAEADLPAGTYQVQIAINYSTSPGSNGYTVAATSWDGGVGAEIIVD